MTEQLRICAKCDQPKALEGFYKRGSGRHPWCSVCCRAYNKAKARERGVKPAKKAPWLNPRSLEASPHKELLEKYESTCGKCAVYHLLATQAEDEEGKKKWWAAYYSTSEQRDKVRLEIMRMLP